MGNSILLMVAKISSLKVNVPENAGETKRDNVLGETELCELVREICQKLRTGRWSGRKGKIKLGVQIQEKSKGTACSVTSPQLIIIINTTFIKAWVGVNLS